MTYKYFIGNRFYFKVYPKNEGGVVDYSSPMILSLPKGAANKLRDAIKNFESQIDENKKRFQPRISLQISGIRTMLALDIVSCVGIMESLTLVAGCSLLLG